MLTQIHHKNFFVWTTSEQSPSFHHPQPSSYHFVHVILPAKRMQSSQLPLKIYSNNTYMVMGLPCFVLSNTLSHLYKTSWNIANQILEGIYLKLKKLPI